ncbi:hypothetical protein RvY_01184 [Ramazzottius varieornatus]|uniref:Major facilitator superfamily (MFS) profile domain-containing protein n=1 Tax=Ramazzottius varieornatus TaxID=947166 RepID=A0A1D1UFS8_RAMVA|nr:hypothetical protein RvY_01184 [Ramazzottius varieornatus]
METKNRITTWIRQRSVSEAARSILLQQEAPLIAKIPEKLPHRRKLHILVITSMAVFSANVAVGMMPMLIPIEITAKHFAYSWTGILFLIYGVVVFACELLQAKIVPTIGTKRTFVFSAAMLGICDIAFGLLGFADKQQVFGVVGCIIRGVEAFCYAGLMNSTLALLCLSIPDKAILGVGLVDSMIGLGYAGGPLIAGALYNVSGYTAPFCLLGGFLILVAIWGQFGLLQVEGGINRPGFASMKRLYLDLLFAACVVVVFAMGIVVGFLEATLEVYLSKFGIGVVEEGSIFLIGWAVAAVSSPIWSFVMNKWGHDYVFLIAGPFLEAIVFVFFGPFPGLKALLSHIGLSVFCFILLAVGTAMGLIAAMNIMLRRAEKFGMSNDINTYAFLSAVWLATLYLGEAIGGIVSGSVLTDHTYKAITVLLISFELLLGTIAIILLSIARWKRHRRQIVARDLEPKVICSELKAGTGTRSQGYGSFTEAPQN